MSRHRNFRNIDYDDLSEEDEDLYSSGSLTNSYGSLENYFKPGQGISLSSFIDDEEPENSPPSQIASSPLKEQKIVPGLSQIQEILGDTYSDAQLIQALKQTNNNVEAAVNWLIRADDEDTFDFEEQEDDVKPFSFDEPSPDDVVLSRQNTAFTREADKAKNNPEVKPVVPFEPIVVPAKHQRKSKETKKKTSEPTKDVTKTEVVDTKPEPSEVVSTPIKQETPIPKPKKAYKQMNVADRSKIEDSITIRKEKPHVNLVVVGHVDAGKSTIMGHLLYNIGVVDQKAMHKFQKESQQQGKASFAYAWVLDEHGAERSRGVTIDVGLNYFETKENRFTLLDAPGHKDFVPNMIVGAAQADAAILVINSNWGEFETGFSVDGQTKEHSVLIRSLGVEQLLVVVNKLDMVDWDEKRFRFIIDQLGPFLKQLGFKARNVMYIPCSGYTGENLSERSTEKLCSWYSGDTLLQAMDRLTKPNREIQGPFRMCISDVYKNMALGVTVSGKIESGVVGVGNTLLKIPGYDICYVKGIESHDKTAEFAGSGEAVSLGLNGIDITSLGIGQFLCDPQQPIPYTNRFVAKIITFTMPFPITKGSEAIIQYQSVSVPVTIKRLLRTLNKTTGEVLQEKPRCIGDSTAASILIETTRPICLELFSVNKQLGRFTLRERGQTIATGIVTQLLRRKQ